MNDDKHSFISLKAKVPRHRYLLPKLFGILQRRFRECPIDLIPFDTEIQDLYETFFRGLRELLQAPKNEILNPNGNGDLFRSLWYTITEWSTQLAVVLARCDSECLDESAIWVVLEELIYCLLRADEKYSREITCGPYILHHPASVHQSDPKLPPATSPRISPLKSPSCAFFKVSRIHRIDRICAIPRPQLIVS
ncbi:uncharacterized protein BT62DRAFT_173321 [Guyanagaster necrorhizus]|uniref:Uncharacterized protein n=1 Tax=Guyanagaster necrorhizus TaxID=856835 RepID=A0A9P7VRV4_9AGAR|nr:uncharacterized protein BT62DRAFT_173321 [Guyanagaster necrorhizus MCA 3950]KAG7445682.1 hypothetical protein BT62DRAFT_173321 [Guyanagaster necrorhizus MCA 3950]